MSNLSTTAITLAILDGQRDNAIAEERRWRLRMQDAQEAMLNARDQIIKWDARINDVLQDMPP